MSWLPDSGWLRALDLRASTFFAVALGCWAVFGLAEFDLLHLGVLPTWARAMFVIVAVLASLLWLMGRWDTGFARFTRWRRRRAILAQLDTLSTSETNLLRGQLAKNEQTFSAPLYDDPVVAGLRRKGLLALSSRRGNIFDYPHMIPDFVWAEMQLRWRILERLQRPPDDPRSEASHGPDDVSGYRGASDRARRI